MPYNFGENSVISSLKEIKKPDVKLLFGENCLIIEKFSEGKAPINGPCYRKKKSPVTKGTICKSVQSSITVDYYYSETECLWKDCKIS
jgi:hypothetical protein